MITSLATNAYLADGVSVKATSLSIQATGRDDHEVDVLTASAAFASFATTSANDSNLFAAHGEVTTDSTTQAYIAPDTSGTASINVDDFALTADHTTYYEASVNNASGSLIGGMSGAKFDVTINQALVAASVGADVTVNADNISIEAGNTTQSGSVSMESAAGVRRGRIGRCRAPGRHPATTRRSSSMTAPRSTTTSQDGSGELVVEAWNDGDVTYDGQVIAFGGLIGIADLIAEVDFAEWDADITLGDGATVTSPGDIRLGTWGQASGRGGRLCFRRRLRGRRRNADRLARGRDQLDHHRPECHHRQRRDYPVVGGCQRHQYRSGRAGPGV